LTSLNMIDGKVVVEGKMFKVKSKNKVLSLSLYVIAHFR
jgi:hypothetical protein